MVTISPKRTRPTKHLLPRRATIWKLRLVLYGLSLLTLVCSMLALLVVAPNNNNNKTRKSTAFEQHIPEDLHRNLVNRDLPIAKRLQEEKDAGRPPDNPSNSHTDTDHPPLPLDNTRVDSVVVEKEHVTKPREEEKKEEKQPPARNHDTEPPIETTTEKNAPPTIPQPPSNTEIKQQEKPEPPRNQPIEDRAPETKSQEEVVESDKNTNTVLAAKEPEILIDVVNNGTVQERSMEQVVNNVKDGEEPSPKMLNTTGATTDAIQPVAHDDESNTGNQSLVSDQQPTVDEKPEKKTIDVGTVDPPNRPQPVVTNDTPDPPPSMFIVIADSRSGSDWIMNRLDEHPHVCASGEAGAAPNTIGFPSGVLIPNGMPWFPDTDLKQGCILAFVKKHVLELLGSLERCRNDHDASNDDLLVHLPRLCRFVEKLKGSENLDLGNTVQIEAMITRLYMDAFAMDDDTMVPCRCPESTKIRGVKVMADWEEHISGFLDHHENIKVIRLRRANILARYMSVNAAMKTNVWQTPTVAEKQRQLDALPDDFSIDLDNLMPQFHFYERDDANADAWGLHHVNSVNNLLGVEYEDCREHSFDCFSKIFQFLGMGDSKAFVESRTDVYSTPFADASVSKVSAVLDKVSNADTVREALGAGGYGHFVGETDYKEIQHIHLISEAQAASFVIRPPPHETAVNTTNMVIGGGTLSANKFEAVCAKLQTMSDDTLVVVSMNTRENSVSINPHIRSHSALYSSVSSFRSKLKSLDGKILASASELCCPSALSHVEPGAFFEVDPNDSSRLKRKARACNSGEEDCGWNGDKNGMLWRNRMRTEAEKRGPEVVRDGFVYLDASLLAGKASDMRNLLATIDVGLKEDERAVLTDYFLQRPDSIIIDYHREDFGQDFPGVLNINRKGCFVADDKKTFQRVKNHGGALPLFVHAGNDLGCHHREDVQPLDIFPKWDESGIRFEPIVDHIDRVLIQNKSMANIDRHFGAEILYAVDGNGLWASNTMRDEYRTLPTEKFLVRAHEILTSGIDTDRWFDLVRIVNNSGFPYWGWYGDFKTCVEEPIPLLTTCAVTGCGKALPSPAYMTIIESKKETREWFYYFHRYEEDYPWESKIRKAVWRGTLSENNPDKVLRSERYRLCELVAQRPASDSDIFDVGLTHIPDFVQAHIEIDVDYLGGLKESISPMPEFQKYAAILDLDGNSWSSRFGSLLCYNSVIIKVEPAFIDYFFYELIPWKHYIPVKSDFSDLVENVAFATDPKNDDIVKEIVVSANQWCAERFVYDQLARDQLDIWQEYARLLTKGDPTWPGKWKARKSALSRDRQVALLN